MTDTTFRLKAFPPLTLAMLAVAQFGAASYARLTGHGQNIEALAGRGGIRPPEVPAGYAFSIWLVIFTLSVAYGLYYASKGQNHSLSRAVSLPAAVLFLCSSLWMLAAQTIGDGWHLVTLIVIMWAASTHGLLLVCNDPTKDRVQTHLLRPLFGLFTGWLTAALFLNITGTFAKEVGMLGLSHNTYALFTLLPAGLLALALLQRTRGEVFVFAAFLWALLGIVIANAQTTPANLPMIAVAAGLAAILIGYFLLLKMKRGV